jgi:hypothetical protein
LCADDLGTAGLDHVLVTCCGERTPELDIRRQEFGAMLEVADVVGMKPETSASVFGDGAMFGYIGR